MTATPAVLGKLIVDTRVVGDEPGVAAGAAPGWGPSILRNLLRVVDGFFFYLVGFITAIATTDNQRVGDLAASTQVVKAR